eukprot:gene3633-3978_t
MSTAEELRLQGNAYFKEKNFSQALQCYSTALALSDLTIDSRTALLTNRAATALKLEDYEGCRRDCLEALRLSPTSLKALYRLATAQHRLRETDDCLLTLKLLLQQDPTNAEGLSLLREVRQAQQMTRGSPVANLLHHLTEKKQEQEQEEEEEAIVSTMHGLVDLCQDDLFQANELVQRGGLLVMEEVVRKTSSSSSLTMNEALKSTLRLLAILTKHSLWVTKHVDYLPPPPPPPATTSATTPASILSSNGEKVYLVGLVRLLRSLAEDHGEEEEVVVVDSLIRSLLVAVMNILKAIPASPDLALPSSSCSSSTSSVEVLFPLTLSLTVVEEILHAIHSVLLLQHEESHSFALDTFSAIISDLPNYFEHDPVLVDSRLESLDDRKARLHREKIFRQRSKEHVELCWNTHTQCDYLSLWAVQVTSEKAFVRSNAISGLGKMIKYLDDIDRTKQFLLPALFESDELLDNNNDDDHHRQRLGETKSSLTGIASLIRPCQARAALELALFVTHPELGWWALQSRQGLAQLLLLLSSQDLPSMEIAAEVLALAAGVDASSELFASLLKDGVVHRLLASSPSQSIRAAAASVMAKLSLKAKALHESSEEVGEILYAVAGVIKAAAAANAKQLPPPPPPPAAATAAKEKQNSQPPSSSSTSLISFSQYDNTALKHGATVIAGGGGGVVQTSSLERAIEVIAAIVGKTFVKEEIVHGSARVAPLIPALTALHIDGRSSSSYGLAHILAALTVTNRELKALALAEKEMTVEQYDKMQELQRIKAQEGAAEAGQSVLEEKQEEVDVDTVDLCKQRIRKIVHHQGILALIRLICVDEQSRGVFIQQGGLKLCCSIANDTNCEKTTRLEAGHAVAKALVTTNPHLLSEPLRLSSFRPLLLLCREVDASLLQQFEALLALTNLLSCGPTEQDRFVADKGVGVVHYLMFSNHLMIRRAATEAFCNMPTHEGLLKLLRQSEQVKLWLALCEDWSPNREECNHKEEEDYKEAFLIARASAGTLAMAAQDEEVVKAMMKEDLPSTLVSLFSTEQPELVHRALVLLHTVLEVSKGNDDDSVAVRLLEGGVVPSMAAVAKVAQPELTSLAKECAALLSNALKK